MNKLDPTHRDVPTPRHWVTHAAFQPWHPYRNVDASRMATLRGLVSY